MLITNVKGCRVMLRSQSEDKGETSFLQQVCSLLTEKHARDIENASPSMTNKEAPSSPA